MNLLLTSVRLPFAVDEIRKLGRRGHRIVASDTYRSSPGLHSRHVAKRILTPTPRYETAAFISNIREVTQAHHIDLVVPSLEEALYLAQERDRLENGTQLFAPSFVTLLRLHDKYAFSQLARTLDLPTPETRLVTDMDELRDAARSYGKFVARPALSRAGVMVAANTGPLASSSLELASAAPTKQQPWIVQPYLEGDEVCTFSIAQHGRVVAHLTYVHPRSLQGRGGVTFETVRRPETLELTRRLVEATGYHGQLGLDFIDTPNGLRAIECNPRPTAGVVMMSDAVLDAAVQDRLDPEPFVVPEGVRAKMSLGLIRDMVLNWRGFPRDLEALFSSARDVYLERDDLMPALYALFAYGQVPRWRAYNPHVRSMRRALLHAFFFDICWDAGPASTYLHPEPTPAEAYVSEAEKNPI